MDFIGRYFNTLPVPSGNIASRSAWASAGARLDTTSATAAVTVIVNFRIRIRLHMIEGAGPPPREEGRVQGVSTVATEAPHGVFRREGAHPIPSR